MGADSKPAVLEIRGLTKYYSHADTPALRNVSLTVREGQHLGLVGANGSGKTTLMRCVVGLVSFRQGEIHTGQGDAFPDFSRQIGYVAEVQEGLENFTCRELLQYAGQMQGMPANEIEQRIQELLEWTRLEERADELVGGFSKGMVQKTALACALIHRPKVLLLDEPMNGLDPEARRRLRDLLLKLEDVTLLLASHNLDEVERICQRIVILKDGEIKGDIDLQADAAEVFSFRVNEEIDEMLERVSGIQISDKLKVASGWQYELQAASQEVQQLLSELGKRGISISGLRSTTRLESLYEKYVK